MRTEPEHAEHLRRLRSRASHTNRGKRLEERLESVHQRYLRAGVYVQRNGTPFVPLSGRTHNGRPLGIPGADAPPDYLAMSDGWAILFDAKSTTDDKWSFSNLEKHQAQSLDAWEAAGGIAGLVVAVENLAVVAWVPWSTLGPRWWAWYRETKRAAPGTASLTRAELEASPYRCPMLDWLPHALAEVHRETARTTTARKA